MVEKRVWAAGCWQWRGKDEGKAGGMVKRDECKKALLEKERDSEMSMSSYTRGALISLWARVVVRTPNQLRVKLSPYL